MATRKKGKQRNRKDGGANGGDSENAPVRAFWSGTITFGLVSIPVDLFAAVRRRDTSMKLVDEDGNALGRQYHCSKDGKLLSNEELVRGYETESGEVVVITDEEFESVAPEMSRDIELNRFVPLEQIPRLYFQRPYFLVPAGRSVKAYHLLARTMERTGRVAIGRLVMRGQESLIAIISENGVLRAQTLRHADEIRPPDQIGLPAPVKAPRRKVEQFAREIERLTRKELDLSELEDRQAHALREMAEKKYTAGRHVIERAEARQAESEGEEGDNVVDLMEVLRKSLSKNAVVRQASSTPPARVAGSKRERSHHERLQTRASAGRRASKRPVANDEQLARASKSDLYKQATKLHIPGRSKMDKSELVKAIKRAG